jgi:hypothetical protein
VNTAKVLDFIISHNTLIIEVLFGLVLIGAIYLAIRLFISDEQMGDSANLSGIEESLRKIIETGGGVGVKSPVLKSASGSTDAVDSSELSEEIDALKRENERLKLDLQEKEAALAAGAASATGEKSSTTGDSGAKGALEEKIRDLEGRLAEYAIIEDDIADLSFYKEETVRLQTELDALKKQIERQKSEARSSGSSPLETPVATPAAEVSPLVEETTKPALATPPYSEPQQPPLQQQQEPLPAVVDTTEVISTSQPEIVEAAAEEKPAEDGSMDFIDNDIMAEFQAAVEAQKAASETKVSAIVKPKLVEAPPPAPVVVPLPPPAAPTASEPASEQPPSQLEEGFDIDKMMTEANGLSKISESTVDVKNALEAGLDTEKLLSEANLMDDFDKFTKKSSS